LIQPVSTHNDQPRRLRRKAAIALFAATAALAGGAQVLFPASGAAMINTGSGCSFADTSCYDPGGSGPSIGQQGEEIHIVDPLSVQDQLERTGHCPLFRCPPRHPGVESSPPPRSGGTKGNGPAKPKAPAKPQDRRKGVEDLLKTLAECRTLRKRLAEMKPERIEAEWIRIEEEGRHLLPKDPYVEKIRSQLSEMMNIRKELGAKRCDFLLPKKNTPFI
jgi:hypothetical protein